MRFLCLIYLTLLYSFQTKALDFNLVLEQIKNKNVELYSKKLDFTLSENEQTQARYTFLPRLDLDHTINRSYETDQAGNHTSLTGQLNIFNGGIDYYSLKEANIKRNRAAQDLIDTEISIEQESIDALLKYIESQKSLKIAKQRVSMSKDSYEAILKSYKRGLTSNIEKDKAEIDFLNSQATLAESAITETQARTEVEKMLQITDSKNLPNEWPWVNRIFSINEEKIRKSEYRPMVRPRTKSLKLQYEEELMKKKGSYSAFLPKIDLSYSWSRQEITKNINPFLVGFNSTDQTALLTFSIPLFSNYKDVVTYKKQKMKIAQVQASLKQAKSQDFSEWTSVKQRLIKNLSTLKSRLKTQSLGEKIYLSSLKRFESGRASVNDLALDRQRVFRSAVLLNQGLLQFHKLLVEYCHYQGRVVDECLQET